MEQEVADLKEAEQSGGIPLSHCGRSITREESLQAELDEQVQRGEQQSRLLSDLQAQLVLANQQAMGLGRKIGDTKAAARSQLESIKGRFNSELKRQREHTDRALSALAKMEAMQAGSAYGNPHQKRGHRCCGGLIRGPRAVENRLFLPPPCTPRASSCPS